MKRTLFSICVIVLATVSCSKHEVDSFDVRSYELTLSGAVPDAKTSLGAVNEDNQIPFLWTEGDQLGLYVMNGSTVTEKNVYALVQSGTESGPGYMSADFKATLSNIAASTDYNVCIYYPFKKTAGSTGQTIAHAIPAFQNQAVSDMSEHFGLSGAFAHASATLTTPADLTDYAPELSFKLSHKTAYVWLRMYAADQALAGWKVKCVKISAPADTYLAGSTSFDVTSGSYTLTSNQSNSVSVTISGGVELSTTVSGNAYLVVFPASVSGKTLTFTYTLENADASKIKTVTHTRAIAEGIAAFEAGSVNRFTEKIPSADATGWVYGTSAIDLSANGTANCYIVSAQGNYSFDATVMGNGDKGVLTNYSATKYHVTSAGIAPSSVELLWQTKQGLITSVALEDGKVTFTKPDAQEGNALIAVKDAEGTILWSWHIWCTDMGPAQRYVVQVDKYGTKDSNTYNGKLLARTGKSYMMMDRDLGATAALSALTTDQAILDQTLGLYYQWGRKDPFIGPSALTQDNHTFATVYDIQGNVLQLPTQVKAAGDTRGIAYAVKHPTEVLYKGYTWYFVADDSAASIGYNLWGLSDGFSISTTTEASITKSIYDPCPPGYTVPVMEPFYATSKSAANDYGVLLSVGGGTKSFYPYAGALANGTGLINDYVGKSGLYYFFTRQRYSGNVNPASHRIGSSGLYANPNTLSANQGMSIRCMQEY